LIQNGIIEVLFLAMLVTYSQNALLIIIEQSGGEMDKNYQLNRLSHLVQWELLTPASMITIKQIVLPMLAGYSYDEIAKNLTIHPSRVSQRMTALKNDLLSQVN
jgi:hypothetical protein